MEIKFLGSSSGEAIPRADCGCSQCISSDKKDRRLRSSILINKKILVDASPDVLKQLSNLQIKKLDSVLITHDHDDHVSGLIHLMRIKSGLRVIRMKPGQHFKLLGIDFFAFKIEHSKVITTVGLEINNVIYIPDSASLSWAMKYLEEVTVAILDGSVIGRPFSGHQSINEIIATVKPLKNLKKIYFTHNGHTRKTHKEMQEFVRQLGDKRFEVAYDKLEIKV